MSAALVLGAGAAASAAEADTEAPSIPGPLVVAEITTSTLVLTWAAATDNVGVVGYDVAQGYTDYVMIKSSPTNSIRLVDLRPSGTYRFSVRARDAAGNSSFPTAQLVLTMPPGDDRPPTVPSRPVVSAVTDTTVTLSWGASTDNVYVALYEVLSITAAGETVVAYAPQHPPTGPTARVFGLTPGTSYTFGVRARDDAGNYSALSAPVTVTTLPSPDAPAGCGVRYRIAAQWQGGQQVDVVIDNPGPAVIDGWTLSWRLPEDQRISQVWGAVLVSAGGGTATVRNAAWSGRIPVGGSVSFGLIATGGGGQPPAAFTLDGRACAAVPA